MKFEHTEVFNFNGALRGMRNPLESCDKTDSYFDKNNNYIIGKNDLSLAQKLIDAGSDHSKFMRQILVCVDITAPLYWWKEFDTYKVGTVINSTSTMHKLATTPITKECFETNDYKDVIVSENINKDKRVFFELVSYINEIIETLERLRQKYIETQDKRYWKELVRWLPSSWLQTRTVTMSYQNIRVMYSTRKNHKLTEWSASFTEWANTLPYAKELIINE